MRKNITLLSMVILFTLSSASFAGPFDPPKGQQYDAHKLTNVEKQAEKDTRKPCGCGRRKAG